MPSPIELTMDVVMKCTLCGAPMGTCDCWEKKLEVEQLCERLKLFLDDKSQRLSPAGRRLLNEVANAFDAMLAPHKRIRAHQMRRKRNSYGLTAMELVIVRRALDQAEQAWMIGIKTLIQLDAEEMKRSQARQLELLRDARAKMFQEG